MKKKHVITIALAILLLLTCTTCTTFDPNTMQKKPSIMLKEFRFKEVTLTDMSLYFEMEIENPYPITLYLDSLQSQIYIDSYSLVTINSQDTLKIKKNSKTITSLSFSITYDQIVNAVSQYLQSDSITLTIKGNMLFSLPRSVAHINVPFTVHQDIPTIKPSISITNVSIRIPSLSDLTTILKNINPLELPQLYADITSFAQKKSFPDSLARFDIPITISFDIIVSNKTKAALLGKHIDYSLLIHESEIVKGQPIIENANGVSKINCVTVISTRNISKTFAQSIIQKNIPYALQGMMIFTANVKNYPFTIPFTISQKGTIKY